MPELNTTPDTSTESCCSVAAQATCCEPSEKDACCDTAAPGGTCGCSAGRTSVEREARSARLVDVEIRPGPEVTP